MPWPPGAALSINDFSDSSPLIFCALRRPALVLRQEGPGAGPIETREGAELTASKDHFAGLDTALAFTAAVDDPGRFRRSRDIGAYLGLVPRRHQSGEIDYTGSISKCGDRRVRTLLYEAANVMLTRYKGALKLKDWAFAIAKRSTMRKARIALARRLAIIMHAMLRHGTEFKPA